MPALHNRRGTRAGLVIAALLVLPAVHLMLRRWPWRVLQHAARLGKRAPRPWPKASRLREVSSAVDRATTLLPIRLHCLEQALTTRVLLAWLGESAMVVIGVSKDGPVLEAHAWVEVGAYRVDASERRFTGLVELG